MRRFATHKTAIVLCLCLISVLVLACERAYIPEFLGGGYISSQASASGVVGAFPADGVFTDNLIQARTFTDGTAVTTVTYLLDDLAGGNQIDASDVLFRTPFGIDFNSDGKIDPVVGYGDEQAVIQILLSDPASPVGEVSYTSLTLDSKRDMEDLADVAVGDIDRDRALDIVAAAEDSLWYYHHPTGQPTTNLTGWGNPDPNDMLRERIDASRMQLTDAEVDAMIAQALGPGINPNDYIITIEQLYTNVEIGDLDNDGDNDLAASRSFVLTLTPRPTLNVEPLLIVDGDVLAFINPGFATNGYNWTAISVGRHERQTRLDRDGASGLLLYDLDADGDLDMISAASQDNNVQVAWFENPVRNRVGAAGSGLGVDEVWNQWRIGSVRDAQGIDIADLTGDGHPDIVATGGEQMQIVLFEQPATGPERSYDWDTYVLATYESHEPRDVKILDINEDGVLELVTGTSAGAICCHEQAVDPRGTWDTNIILTYDPPGEVGLLGYGDLDGDGDLDLIAVLAGSDDNACRINWIRNDTASLALSAGQ